MCTKGYQINAHRVHILTEINLEFLRKRKKNAYKESKGVAGFHRLNSLILEFKTLH